MSTLGINIRRFRDKFGLTQSQLGEKIGVAESTISLYESGKREPDLATLQNIANFFKVTIDHLLGRVDEEKKEPFHSIPIYTSKVRAGLPILVDGNVEEYIDIPNNIKADFGAYVVGDSMMYVGIHSGDLAMFKKPNGDLPINQIVVASVENYDWEANLKFFVKDNGHYALRSANPEYEDIVFTENHHIVGILTNLVKQAPGLPDYSRMLRIKEDSDERWSDVVSLAANHGLEPEQVKSLLQINLQAAFALTKKR
ncbi:HTH-type transcriptional regulator Xre [Sporomusa ovata DSM 2662]|uniref:SOS-response repressor and protease LexA n=1 Tax=Sporomusa ovata TaxID=2378 RepID=A0A0U1L1Y7_9FIRM|nr:S24 family peptidase [Sporomusa ovata]EQB27503.1 SOS-response transcriptional repressor [Sporomusa ovata DSM 2662]CQR73349.1 SOS-response repressor and protease LexA [Sporomusa ovata]